mgnify:CR=1 FL=1
MDKSFSIFDMTDQKHIVKEILFQKFQKLMEFVKVLVVDKRPHIAGNVYTEEIEEIQEKYFSIYAELLSGGLIDGELDGSDWGFIRENENETWDAEYNLMAEIKRLELLT